MRPRVLEPMPITVPDRIAFDVLRIPIDEQVRRLVVKNPQARAAKAQVTQMLNVSSTEFDRALMSRTSLGPANVVAMERLLLSIDASQTAARHETNRAVHSKLGLFYGDSVPTHKTAPSASATADDDESSAAGYREPLSVILADLGGALRAIDSGYALFDAPALARALDSARDSCSALADSIRSDIEADLNGTLS